jgi:predicted phage terminase large subunit-like protein
MSTKTTTKKTKSKEPELSIKPQSGPQETFLSTCADIAIYGGAAGGGKSWALLLEPLRYVTNTPDFYAVFFRRTTVQVRNPGGLFDESYKLYHPVGGHPINHVLEWTWEGGGKIKFAHLEHDNTVHDWQGSQIPLILFDELTHFSQNQFFYLLSRNRSICGVKPYMRASCNPDADSWVAQLLSWWIDQETGFPIPERAGVLRWFVRVNDSIVWGDTKEQLMALHADTEPLSLTFIPAKLSDNQILCKADPSYKSKLLGMNMVERARLLDGNWKIRPSAGMYFQRSWVEIIDALPAKMLLFRYWDLAASEPNPGQPDPDYTVGVKMGYKDGLYYIIDRVKFRGSPARVESMIKNTASADSGVVSIGIDQDPGQAGKVQASYLTAALAGYYVRFFANQKNKILRFSPFSAQAQVGNVKVLRGEWNEDFFDTLEGFPDSNHDDDVDAVSGAFQMTMLGGPIEFSSTGVRRATTRIDNFMR